jgi:TolB-like protein
MFTDMVGYTALGQRNESLSLALVAEQRKVIRPILAKHNGKEIKTIGDAFLVEFPSAVDAMRCAYDIQRAVREFNLSLAAESRIHLRVGIHVGEVVESEGDISGDAVNVASRIEPLAEDGGVCLTRQVYDHVHNKVDIPVSSLGPKTLKNVSEPVEVYAMVMPWGGERAGPAAHSDEKRIAVLPFASLSPDPNDEYFADGMTEELISTVSNISHLRVISRTSVMGYKGTSKKAREIGLELDVGSLLEGSVRKSGDRVRITVQLVSVKEDEYLWSQSYDRELRDVFALQSEIAKQVADSLRVKIQSKEERLMERSPTQVVEAHELYLKGRYQWNKRTREGVHKALEFFRQAIEEDPSFALAYSGMADSYLVLPSLDPQPQREAYLKAKELSVKALELDDSLAEAHTSLASSLENCDWDWEGAEREFRRAVELNPSYATGHHWYALHLTRFAGRPEEGIQEMLRAAELDPLSPQIGSNLADAYAYASRWDEAVAQCKRVLEMEPDFFTANYCLARAYVGKSMFREAIDVAEGLVRSMPEEPLVKAVLGTIYGLTGMQERGKEILGEVQELSKTQYVPPSLLMQMCFSVGDMDGTYEWMRRDCDEHGMAVPMWRWDPLVKKIWADPRFKELAKRTGLA